MGMVHGAQGMENGERKPETGRTGQADFHSVGVAR